MKSVPDSQDNLPVIGGNEQNVVVLLASLIDLANGLVSGSNTLDGGLVHAGVANHVGRGEVVHDKVELLLAKALSHLGTDGSCTHLWVKIVGSNSGRRDHIAGFAREILFDTTVKEESDVSVFLSLSNVALLEVLLGKPFGQHVTHVLRGESNIEGVVSLVLGHGGEGDVLGVGEVGTRGTVMVAQQLGDFTDAIRAVVEEEEGIVIYTGSISYHHIVFWAWTTRTLDTAFLAANNDGLQELIVLVLLVALLDGL